MAEIIDMDHRRRENNLITEEPLEFRRGDWRGGHAMLCSRKESQRYEAHRHEAFRQPGHSHLQFVPNHILLSDGYHYTLEGLFRHRRDPALMRRVYRLAGLMECITNASSPVLRTDLLRRFYEFILEERKQLQVVWRGNVHQFLFPLHPDHYNPNSFTNRIAAASSLKELYEGIEAETNRQFQILGDFYVFYLPLNLFPVNGGSDTP